MLQFKISHLFGRWINILLGAQLHWNEISAIDGTSRHTDTYAHSQKQTPFCTDTHALIHTCSSCEEKMKPNIAMILNLTAAFCLRSQICNGIDCAPRNASSSNEWSELCHENAEWSHTPLNGSNMRYTSTALGNIDFCLGSIEFKRLPLWRRAF